MTLFLEFDGALRPDPCVAQFKFWQRNSIEGILREFPQVDIVLSTTWRLRNPMDATSDTQKHHFSTDITDRIVGSRQITRAWLAIRRRTALISNTQRAEEYDDPREVFEGDQK
ncbi:MAG: HAD domain-containing protein [Polaromonas sp.]|uniref:HAD domain-containing protein n=1 Tax=Polaromonas sp. TaxID=1869339 RepID=UPI002487D052|nr:HAD domain-containing protein [Polaromonas sp.]MDI1269256.1 HAD domain-containing protein [Polaromonas sp.]